MHTKIEKATVADIIQIIQLLKTSWFDTYEGIYNHDFIEKLTNDWHNEEAILAQINDKNTAFHVLKLDSVIKGLIALHTTSNVGIGYLSKLYVHPGSKGKGIGTKLFNHALENMSFNKVLIEVESVNEAAKKFFRAKGFTFVKSEFEKLYGVESKIDVFEKVLISSSNLTKWTTVQPA